MAEWVKIKGYKPIYYVSDSGLVKSIERETPCNTGVGLRKERILKTAYVRRYKNVFLYDESGKRHSVLLHRLVAENFVSNPNNFKEIDHIDGNPENNRADNLRWVTHKDNCNNPNTIKKIVGRISARRKKIKCFDLEGNFIAEYDSMTEAAKCNNVLRENVSKCCRGLYKYTGRFTYKYA